MSLANQLCLQAWQAYLSIMEHLLQKLIVLLSCCQLSLSSSNLPFSSDSHGSHFLPGSLYTSTRSSIALTTQCKRGLLGSQF